MLEKSTYYILDAQGKRKQNFRRPSVSAGTMNTYDHEVTDDAVLYTLKERQIYGSSRLGIYDDSISMYSENTSKYINEDKGHKYYELSNHLGNVLTVISDKKIPKVAPAKILDFESPITESFDYGDVCVPNILFYEASEYSGHTYEVDANGNTVYQIDGNPHSVQYSLDGLTPGETYNIAGLFISNNSSVSVEVRSCENSGVITNPSFTSVGDFAVSFVAPYENVRIKFLSLGGSWSADDITFSGPGLGSSANCFIADIVNIADYSPFGVQLDGRTMTSDKYRYGYQGQEKDDEIKGEGNSVSYKYRMHDARIGRFFAIDPLAPKYPHYTPYSFSGNKVIHAVELEGLEEKIIILSPAHAGGKKVIELTNDVKVSEFVAERNSWSQAFLDFEGAWGGNSNYHAFKNIKVGDDFLSKGVLTIDLTGGEAKASYTLVDNMKESVYIGPDNPKSLMGKDLYDIFPQDLADAAARVHDLGYDEVEAAGLQGVLSSETLDIDIALVRTCNKIKEMYLNKEIDSFTELEVSKKTFKRANFIVNAFTGVIASKLDKSDINLIDRVMRSLTDVSDMVIEEETKRDDFK